MTKIKEDFVLDELSKEELESISEAEIEEYVERKSKTQELGKPIDYCRKKYEEAVTVCPFSKNARKHLDSIYKCYICPKNPDIKRN